jgi:hypothetical protein
MRKRILEVFLAATLAVTVGNAAAVPYSFNNIADSNGPFSFFSAPSLNNSGTVAFTALLDTFEQGVFTGRGGPITTIVDTTGQEAGSPSINDSGTVAFQASRGNGQEVVTSKGGHTTTLYVIRGVWFLEGFSQQPGHGGVRSLRAGA